MQKIMIVSDTHKKHEYLIEALNNEPDLDMLIHLGDVEGEEDYIRALVDCETVIIAGNNDFFSDLEREIVMKIEDYTVLLTHGNYYYVSVGLDTLRQEAKGRDIDIAMFGHIHRPVIDIQDGVTLISPGSISYPRQDGKRPTYILMKIDENGVAEYELKYL